MKKSVLKTMSLFCMIFTLLFTALPVQAMELSDVQTQAAAAVKKGWVKEKAGYCYYENGKKVTNKLKKIGKYYYYLGANGVRKTGWYTVKMTVNKKTVYRTFYFNTKGASTGKYTTADSTMMKKLDQAIVKNKIAPSKLTTTSQKKAAIKKLYDYTVKTYKYKRVMGFKATKGWQYDFAKQMLVQGAGSCYHDAAVFGALVKRATGLPVRVCYGTANGVLNKGRSQAHGWVEVKLGNTWYIYDTNAGRFSNVTKNWYFKKASAMTKYYKATEKTDVEL